MPLTLAASSASRSQSVIAFAAAMGLSSQKPRLPTYDALAAEYGSARRTVARAAEMLKAVGLVVGVPGSGIYVAES